MNSQEGNTSVVVSEGQAELQPPVSSSSDDSNGVSLSSPGVNDLKKKLWGASPDGKNPSLNQWQNTSTDTTKMQEIARANHSVTKNSVSTPGRATVASPPSLTASTNRGVNDLKKKLWGSSPDGTNSLNQWQTAPTPSSNAAPSSPASTQSKRNSVAKLQKDLWGGGDSGDATSPSLQIRHENETSIDDGSEHKEERFLSGDTEDQHYREELVRLHWWINNGKVLVQQVQTGEYKMARDKKSDVDDDKMSKCVGDYHGNHIAVSSNYKDIHSSSQNALIVPDINKDSDDKRERNTSDENNCFILLFRHCFK